MQSAYMQLQICLVKEFIKRRPTTYLQNIGPSLDII